MKVYEVVGFVVDETIFCPEHTTKRDCPIFAEDSEPGDYCAECLVEYDAQQSLKEPKYRYPASTNAPWIYLDGCEPEPV